jgi:hypothetical protein
MAADYLQKFILVVGVPQQINTGGSIIAYDFTNNSQFDIDVAWGIGKPIALSIPPTTIWRGAKPTSSLLISGNKWGGVLVVTASFPGGGTPPLNSAAAQLTVHGYVKGNEPPEQVTALNTMTTVGNSVLQANQIFNPDLLAPGSQVLFTEDSLISPHNFGQIGQDGSGAFGSNVVLNPLNQVSWTVGGALYARSLSAGTPVTLVANTQETGYFGFIQNNAVNTSTIGGGANFKTTMTNTPSSVTTSDIQTSNAGAASVANIRTTGCTIFWTPVAAGQSFRECTYTTVGN